MELNYICACKDIGIGTYKNQIQIIVPKNIKLYKNNPEKEMRKNVCIDKCLELEIKELWKLGIRTTGCCCGHNKLEPYIGVIEEDIQKMKDLGYEVAYNPNRPKDEDSFIPNTIKMQYSKKELIEKIMEQIFCEGFSVTPNLIKKTLEDNLPKDIVPVSEVGEKNNNSRVVSEEIDRVKKIWKRCTK